MQAPKTDSSTSQPVPLEEAYSDLVEHLIRFDPLELLCNVTLRYLRQDARKFVGEADEANRWVVRVELIAGIILTRPYPINPTSKVTSHAIERLHGLLERYHFLLLESIADESQSSRGSSDFDGHDLLETVRAYSYSVRGTAHRHQYTMFMDELYSPHDRWFEDNLGFTIKEAIVLVKAFLKEYDNRINKEKLVSRKHAVNAVKDANVDGDCKRKLENMAYIEHYFGRAREFLGISIDELTHFSHIPRSTCISILARLSQEIGYQNPNYPNTHRDPYSAPWDFNTLHERPFVKSEDRYWMILPAVVRQALMSTFYFDLMADPDYRPEFTKSRGKWLEIKTAECLRGVFKRTEVLCNPRYPNGNELIDILVLHNETAFIVECKSKGLTLDATSGRQIGELKKSLKKAVGIAYIQCDRARKYLFKDPHAKLRVGDRDLSLVIDIQRIKRVFLVIVTAAPLQALATMWASINSEVELFRDGDYPWALSIADLETVTEVLSTPIRFIHYASRRFEFTQRDWHILADERDLLGSYFTKDLCINDQQYQDYNLLGLFGMSGPIDEYMFRKHSLGQDVDRPAYREPNGFSELIEDISNSADSSRDDVALAILNMSTSSQVMFMEKMNQTVDKTLKDGSCHDFTMTDNDRSHAVVFIAMNARGNREILYSQVSTYANQVMHGFGFSEVFAIASDSSTDNAVDCVFYWASDTRD